TESYVYSYLAAPDPNAGLLSSVLLRRQVNGGPSWTTVRQVAYAYYDGSKPYGNLGDLLSATVEDPSGNALGTPHYRSYTSADSGSVGYVHGLKYVFGEAAYARLVTALGATPPTSATDAQVSAYADAAYQYNPSSKAVTQVVLAGAGGAATGGQGTYTYS